MKASKTKNELSLAFKGILTFKRKIKGVKNLKIAGKRKKTKSTRKR